LLARGKAWKALGVQGELFDRPPPRRVVNLDSVQYEARPKVGGGVVVGKRGSREVHINVAGCVAAGANRESEKAGLTRKAPMEVPVCQRRAGRHRTVSALRPTEPNDRSHRTTDFASSDCLPITKITTCGYLCFLNIIV
jgi:hypothetical protein